MLFLGIGLWEGCRCTRKEVHSHDNPRSWTVTTCIAEPRFGLCIHVVTVSQWQGLEEFCVGRPALEDEYSTQNLRCRRVQMSYTTKPGLKEKEIWLTAYSLLKSVMNIVSVLRKMCAQDSKKLCALCGMYERGTILMCNRRQYPHCISKGCAVMYKCMSSNW